MTLSLPQSFIQGAQTVSVRPKALLPIVRRWYTSEAYVGQWSGPTSSPRHPTGTCDVIVTSRDVIESVTSDKRPGWRA